MLWTSKIPKNICFFINSIVLIQKQVKNKNSNWSIFPIVPLYKIVKWNQFVLQTLSASLEHSVALFIRINGKILPSPLVNKINLYETKYFTKTAASSLNYQLLILYFLLAIILHKDSALKMWMVQPQIRTSSKNLLLVYTPMLLILWNLIFTNVKSHIYFCLGKRWNYICLKW